MTADVAPKRKWYRRSKSPDKATPDAKWFRRSQSPGGLGVGEDVVRVRYGSPIDPSMNNDGGLGSYRVSQTGEIISGDQMVKIENWDAVNESGNAIGGYNYHNRMGYGTLREEGDEQIRRLQKTSNLKSKRTTDSETPKFDFVMREKDCLDATFDGVESYGCKDATGEIFPAGAPPLSPEAAQELQNTLDGDFLSCDAANVSIEESDSGTAAAEKNDCLDRTCDTAERYGCGERTGEIFSASADSIPSKVARDAQQTLDGRFLSCGTKDNEQASTSSDNIPSGYCADNGSVPGFGVMAGMIVERLLGRENESVTNKTSSSCNTPNTATDSDDYDLEQNGQLSYDAHNLRIDRENSILDVDSSNRGESQSRLEQLRQNKRAIERGFRSTVHTIAQTIVIPRDSLYENEDDSSIESGMPISKLKAGTTATDKQTKQYNLGRKLALTVTVLLLSIGTMVLAAALFWPTRKLT